MNTNGGGNDDAKFIISAEWFRHCHAVLTSASGQPDPEFANRIKNVWPPANSPLARAMVAVGIEGAGTGGGGDAAMDGAGPGNDDGDGDGNGNGSGGEKKRRKADAVAAAETARTFGIDAHSEKKRREEEDVLACIQEIEDARLTWVKEDGWPMEEDANDSGE